MTAAERQARFKARQRGRIAEFEREVRELKAALANARDVGDGVGKPFTDATGTRGGFS